MQVRGFYLHVEGSAGDGVGVGGGHPDGQLNRAHGGSDDEHSLLGALGDQRTEQCNGVDVRTDGKSNVLAQFF